MRASRKKEGSSSMIWILPIAAVLLLGVMLFFHFEADILDRRHASTVVEETVVIPPRDDETVIQDDEAAPPRETDAAAQEPPAQEPVVDPDSPYGLMGPVGEVQRGAYTIVLHSIVNENRARIEKRGFEEEGYKATIWQARLPDGSRTWRVGVGQFESVSDAEQAIPQLPEPYRSNNFIIRIR